MPKLLIKLVSLVLLLVFSQCVHDLLLDAAVSVHCFSTVLAATKRPGLADDGIKRGRDESIVINGLYLGMDIDRVLSVLKKNIPGMRIRVAGRGDKVTGEHDYWVRLRKPGVIAPVFNNSCLIINNNGLVVADAYGKVRSIMLSEDIVNHLFDAHDLEPGAFVEKFANVYGISEMTTSADGASSRYVNSSGEEVCIYKKNKAL